MTSLKLISMDELNRLVDVCRILSSAPFYSKLGAGGVLAIYLTAREMNLPPMFCLNGGLHNIEGKVVLSSQLINMMLINAGWDVKFITMTDKLCHLQFVYPGGKRVEEFKYSIEDAQKAGYFGVKGVDPNNGQEFYKKKPKDNWIYHPLDMLFARCITSGGRKYAPRVLGNCYGQGELDGDEFIIPTTPTDIQKAQNYIPKQEPVKALEDNRVQCPALDQALIQFKQKHNIVEGQPIYDYVVKVANQKKINVDLAMDLCFKNEGTFLKAFSDMQEREKAKAQPTENVA